MPPIDPTIIQNFPAIIAAAVVVNILLFVLQWAFTGGHPNDSARWWNRLISRSGPVISVLLGAVVGVVNKDIGFAAGLIGGWGAAWNFNFFTRTIQGK